MGSLDLDERSAAAPDDLKFASRAVHAGNASASAVARPVVTPIYATVGFEAESAEALEQIFAGVRPGFAYTRHHNPTVAALESAVTELEGAAGTVAFASGMAALQAALAAANLSRGDVVLSSREIFCSTQALFHHVCEQVGATLCYCSFRHRDRLRRRIRELRPRVIFMEVMSNPLLRICDVPMVVDLAREAGDATIVVDATLTTPRLMRPLEHGVDLIVHSSTKYLNGHGDVAGGVVCSNAQPLLDRLGKLGHLCGAVLGPFEAWLTLRGMKTLAIRMERQCASARDIAEWLTRDERVSQVHYPGLAAHPDYPMTTRLLSDGLCGGIVSIQLRGAKREQILRLMDVVRLWRAAPTLGDLYSQIVYPSMAPADDHAPFWNPRCGIREDLVRLSIGIEDPDDLYADLRRAFDIVLG